MASTENDNNGDFADSLFEGMILFSPSDLSFTPQSPPSVNNSESQPLDEDLFSDLTLTTQSQPSDSDSPIPTVSEQPPLRQISRKKKRAVRIGYGRDESKFERLDSNSNSNFYEQITEIPSTVSSIEPNELKIERVDSNITEIDEEKQNLEFSSAEFVHNGSKDENLHENVEEKVKEIEEKREEEQYIEEKLKLIKARTAAKQNETKKKAVILSSRRKELSRRRRKGMENVNLSMEMYKEMEKELEGAVEREDFEKAERLSESLAEKEKEKDGLFGELRELEVECDDCDLKMQEVIQLQIEVEEEGVVMLEEFAKDAVDHADSVLKKAEEINSKEIEEWESSMEILEANKMEIETESQLIYEARSGLENSIESFIEDDRKEVEMLRKKQDILSHELNELLALVRLKEAEIAENDAQIHKVEGKISDVISNFHESQSSIDVKHGNLQLSLSKLESESEALNLKKKEIDEFILQAQRERSKVTELASVSLDEAKTSRDLIEQRKRLATSILKSREDKVKFAKAEERILEEIQILRRQISAARTTLQELSSTRVSIQQEIASHNQRIAFIDKRGPELEAEKKVAAAARNFKEAGRIATEAKSLNIEKESLQNKKEKSILDLDKLEEEIKDTIEQIQESEGLISLKEKEAAIAGCKRLYLVATSARAERLAAIEMGDLEEGESLLKEAEAAEIKARELQVNYGLELEANENL